MAKDIKQFLSSLETLSQNIKQVTTQEALQFQFENIGLMRGILEGDTVLKANKAVLQAFAQLLTVYEAKKKEFNSPVTVVSTEMVRDMAQQARDNVMNQVPGSVNLKATDTFLKQAKPSKTEGGLFSCCRQQLDTLDEEQPLLRPAKGGQ